MANIYVEGKGPQGVQAKESLLPAAVAGYTRGLAVTYGVDSLHAALVAAAGSLAIGLLEEDAINVNNPASVIEFGQTVAQIGANVAALQPLMTNAAGQLVPATAGQPVTAIALEPQVYVAPGSYATVFVVAILGITLPGSVVSYYAAAGALTVPEGDSTAVVNGAAALAMTLAQPTAAQDGINLFVTAGTARAHTVTTAANGVNGAKHVVTFAAQGDGVVLEAINQVWIVRSLVGGAVLS
ncbi:MAG: hypothetical protein P4K83_02130 [Terracidiphilus sp.]|nr:hypothetical protein [Terracidiphilus sp.]